jgi:zinc protease
MIDQFTTTLVLRAGMLLAGAVFAVAALAVAVPEAAGEPRASRFTLANGMEVVVIPDHRAPVVTHMVWYKVGAADEPPGKSGIAHFLEHLMFKGTEKLAPGEFSRIVARNGGEDNAFTSHDATAYFQRMASDRLSLVMEMEADRMANLRLAEEDVLTERKVILEERRSRVDNDPSSILNEQMRAALYQVHPYGAPVIGWENQISQLGPADATRFYERYYAPNNAVLVVAGDVTPEEVKKLAQETYGKVEAVDDRVREPRPQEPAHAARIRVTREDPRAGSATIQRYYLAPSYPVAEPGEAEALELLMQVAASGTTSRLYKKLVVEQELAAEAGGGYSGSGLDSGRLSIYAIPSDGVPVREVEAAMDAVLADIRDNGITQEELDRARTATIADHVYGSDSQTSLARRYGWALVTGRTVEDVESRVERLEEVSLADVKRVANKYLDETQSVTGVLLPADRTTTETEKTGDAAEKS